MPSVLFICTANRFRSPLAESFFRSILAANAVANFEVSSAGTWAVSGLPALDDAIKIASSYNLDITSHRSSSINSTLLCNYDLIIVMESGHKEAINIEFPTCQDRVYLLSEAAGHLNFDIPDPSAKNESSQSIGRELSMMITEGWQNIVSLAKRVEQNHQ